MDATATEEFRPIPHATRDAGARGLSAGPDPFFGSGAADLPHRDDWILAQRAVGGCNDSAERILRECLPKVLAALEHMCSGDTKSSEKAREIAADLLSECFGGRSGSSRRDCLLALYGGRSSLTGWLVVCAKSRLKNWWRSAENRKTFSLEGALASEPEQSAAGGTNQLVEQETVQMLADALAVSFASLGARQQVFIRLVFLHGIQRDRIANFWGVHPSNVGRQISEGIEKIRASTLLNLRAMDPWLQITWEDCLWIAENRADILHGETAS